MAVGCCLLSTQQALAVGELQAGADARDVQVATAVTGRAPSKARLVKLYSNHGGKAKMLASDVKKADGYQFRISRSKSFRGRVKTATTTKRKCSFTGLTPGKVHYASVRAYRILGDKVKWGEWSDTRSVTIRTVRLGFVSFNKSGSGGGWSAIRRCGFKAIGITSPYDPDFTRVDGIVVPGGADIHPKFYGQKLDPHTSLEKESLSRLKIKVCARCAREGKPLLGICGGEQALNVALGGTLIQHMKGGYHSGSRYVLIKKGSWLRETFGRVERTTHYHHQCVAKLGKGLIATQWDVKDGYIEAIEHETLPLYGLQWHPEMMGERGRKVYELFARVCMRYV